jgi:hypothetical protein
MIVVHLQTLVGAKNTYWDGQKYDFEVRFSRNFPFDPPRLHFPLTALNAKSIRHPAIGRNGDLELRSVSRDQWNCSWTMLPIIREVQALFSTVPDTRCGDATSPLLSLPETQIFAVASYLSISGVLSLSQTCKKATLLMQSNNLWAELYFTRCQVPAPILYTFGSALTGAGPGPLREVSAGSSTCEWRHSREAFIRAYQCYGEARKYRVPNAECLAANELAMLLPLAYPTEYQQAVDNQPAPSQPAEPLPPPMVTAAMAAAGFGAPTHMQSAQHAGPWQLPPATETAFVDALRYRCLRSARLAQWLGGEDCLRANIEQNYWGDLSVTMLIFLSSLAHTVGLSDAQKVSLATRVAHIAEHQARMLQRKTRKMRGVQQEGGNTVGQDEHPPQVPPTVAVTEGAVPESPIQLKLRLTQQLLRVGAARAGGVKENCDSFALQHSLQVTALVSYCTTRTSFSFFNALLNIIHHRALT